MTAESTLESDPFDDRRLARNPIAIVGMSGLFPKAKNYREYWQNIVDGVDCTEEVPASRWSLDDYYDADHGAADKTYSRRGAFLPDVDFDPLEFGVPPNQLEVTSTMQTLSLGVARDLLVDAGATGSQWYDPSRTGVVMGTTGPVPLTHPLAARLSTPILKEAARSCGLSEEDADAIAAKFVAAFAPWEENSFPGLLSNVVAGRIANRFGLGGINCTVDAACAASLAAMRTAIAELQDGRADTMITGGVDTENSIFIYMCFSKVGALSPSDRISPFSSAADGTLLGEGISMLALRRLSDAKRDGNRIYAVIKGLGSSSDGRSKSIYAPRAEGQRIALNRAYADAECAPSSVELFEAHATGTAVGDRTELAALGGLLSDSSDEAQFAALGSVKSQIGHTKGAAGTASVMKLALGLYHKILPGTINVDEPNAEIEKTSPYYVNTRTRPWIRDPQRPTRRAAASAMGFGGTNFHVVLEEADADRGAIRTVHDAPRALIWHAADVGALVELVGSGDPSDSGDIPDEHARLGFVAVDADGEAHLRELAVEQLTKNPAATHWNHPEGLFFRSAAMPDIKVGALFSGQGSQYVDMGAGAVMNTPSVAEMFDVANEAFAGQSPRLGSVVFPPPVFDDAARADQEATLRRTQFAQPAIGALSAGQFAFFAELGFRADGYLGHSFGELTALWASGAVDTQDYFVLAHARGEAMAPVAGADSGTMLAVAATREQVEQVVADIDDVRVCNHNAPDQLVVGGGAAAVAQVETRCSALGYTTRALPVSAAFHTPYVAHAVEAFRPVVESLHIGQPDAPVFANSPQGRYGSDVAENRATLVDQMMQPVEFVSALESMREIGCTVFVEFGPKQVLTSLVRRTLGDDVVAIATDSGPLGDSDVPLKRAAVQLAVLGCRLVGINRYRFEAPVPAKGSGMTVALSAPEYVPETRRKAYADALSDGYRVSVAPSPPESTVSTPPRVLEMIVPQYVPNQSGDLDAALAAHLDTHKQYLDGQLDVARELAGALRSSALDAGLVRAIEAVKDHGIAISHTHTRATEVLGQLAELELGAAPRPDSNRSRTVPSTRHTAPASTLEQRPEPRAIAAPAPLAARAPMSAPVVAPVPSPPSGGVSAAQLRLALQEVVAEKTGYPVEMVDPAMDLEADLGVDSIKRVQVLGAVQERFPQLPSLGPEQLGVLRTLDQIVELLAIPDAPAPAPAVVSTPSAPTGGVSAAQLRLALQEVVAEKTGYPVEMVDPAMDLEADLGVDSIKRVQVLGAVQERFPQLPSLGPEQLGVLRTLDQIVELLAVGSDVYPKADAAATLPRHTIELVALPAVDRIDQAYRQAPKAVLVDIGTGGTGDHSEIDALARLLTGRGWSVQRVQVSGRLSDVESALVHALTDPMDLCLVVVDGATDWSAAQDCLASSILVAKHALPPLLDMRRSGARVAFVTVTRIDGALGFGDSDDPVRALIGGVGGVVKTLAAEHSQLFARALDIHPAIVADRFAEIVLAEISDAALDTLEVGVGELGDRHTLVPSLHGQSSSQTVVTQGSAADATTLTASDVVLVTGGARGVTALCVRELARNCAAQFVLMGRTELTPEPQWARGVAVSDLQGAAIRAMAGSRPTPREVDTACSNIRATREILETLDELDGRGQYIAVDVTDAAAVRSALEPLRMSVTAIVHGAGVLADSLLGVKTIDEITRVLDPKIAGLAAVMDALATEHESSPVRHLVLFTSVAGLFGNSGQSDYAAGNEALSRFAAAWKNRHPDRHATAVDWGAWDGGMVTPELRGYFLGRGVSLLDPGLGARAFVEQFTAPRADDRVVLIGEAASLTDEVPSAGGTFVARRDIDGLGEHRIIAAHRIGSHAVLPATFGLGAMINVVERAHPGQCVVSVRDFQVHKGIVFDHPVSELSIRVVEEPAQEARNGHWRSVVRASVLGAGPSNPVPHYAATLVLDSCPDASPTMVPTWSDVGVSAASLYREATQFHAPPLQGMRKILVDEDDSLILECQLPGGPVAIGAFAGVLHNPVLADVILQGPPVLGQRLLDSACLPLGIGRIDYYEALPENEPFVLIVGNARARTADVLVDATATTTNGVVLQRFTDVSVVTTPDLSDKFREAVRQWIS